MPLPGMVFADRVVVEAAFVLRGLEALLDRPPAAGHGQEGVQGGALGCEAHVVNRSGFGRDFR